MGTKVPFYPILLAGGSGTRFWPRSRRAQPKQILALDGEESMIQQTAKRLKPLASSENFWILSNEMLAPRLREQLQCIPGSHILAEPLARNTAPAAGLAAFLLERHAPEAVLGMFPADHTIADEKQFLKTLEQAIEIAAHNGNIVVLGVKPTHPETGYGYIEVGSTVSNGVRRVRRFTEKPNLDRAREFVGSGNYFWNSGIFLWKAQTLADAVREHLPETAPFLEQIAEAFGTPEFEKVLAEQYPKCENISVDYAVLEPRSAKGEHRSNLYCVPAEFGWNDLGSWSALYEHQKSSSDSSRNVVEALGSLTSEATGNYVYAPNKFVALIGVDDLVVVETDDAILVVPRERSQDVGTLVSRLKEMKRDDLL